MDTDEHDTLSASELDRIEKAIFEVARQQRGKRVPVSLPFPDFWDRAVHLVIHLEQEADRMRREGVGSARLSTGIRRMANIRTQIRNLANLRFALQPLLVGTPARRLLPCLQCSSEAPAFR